MKYKRNPDVSFADLDNEITLFNSQSSEYINLNESASVIWLFIEESKTIEEIKKQLMSLFDVNEIECIESINIFVKKLLEDNLIINVNE